MVQCQLYRGWSSTAGTVKLLQYNLVPVKYLVMDFVLLTLCFIICAVTAFWPTAHSAGRFKVCRYLP
jgi:hypothetical protein